MIVNIAKYKKYIISSLTMFILIVVPRMVFAATACNPVVVEGVVIHTPIQILCPFLKIINVGLLLSGVVLAVMIGVGAIKMSASLGDPKGMQASLRTFLFAVIGFFLVVGAFSVLAILNNTLGLGLGGGYDSAEGLTQGIMTRWSTFLNETFRLWEDAPGL